MLELAEASKRGGPATKAAYTATIKATFDKRRREGFYPFHRALPPTLVVGSIVHPCPSLSQEDGQAEAKRSGILFKPKPLREAYAGFLVRALSDGKKANSPLRLRRR